MKKNEKYAEKRPKSQINSFWGYLEENSQSENVLFEVVSDH